MVRYASILIVLLSGMVLVVGSAPAAETVTRKHDKPVLGDVTGVSKTEVTVKVKGAKEDTVKVPANDVQGISWTGEPPEANLARSDEAGGRFQRAIDGYQKALQSIKSANAQAKVDLEYSQTRAMAKLALTESSRLDEAIKKLEEFRTNQPDHYRYFEAVGLLGQLHLVKKDFDKARAMFDALAKAPWKESQMAAKIATARLLQAEAKPDEAAAAFDAVIEQPADGRVEETQRKEATLGKAQVLIAQKKFDEARKLLEALVALKDVDDRELAEAYLRLGDCFREQGQDKDALLAYLRVDVLFPQEKLLDAEALFHLTDLWKKAGYKDRSAEAREKLESDDLKNTPWARQLK